ncbi:MAG: tetratricopeptide repeat protein [Selenomonadaceae bacterium]
MASLKKKIKNARLKKEEKLTDSKIAELKLQMKVLMDEKQYADAIDVMAEIATLRKMDAEVMGWGAAAYYACGDYERASTWVDNALSFDGKNLDARLLLGKICLKKNRTEDALKVYEFILEGYGDNVSDSIKEEITECLVEAGVSDVERYANINELLQKHKKEETARKVSASAAVNKMKELLRKRSTASKE